MKKIILVLSSFILSSMISKISAEASGEIPIGKQIWMTENLNVDRFRNGDPIPHVKTNEEWERAVENQQPAWCYYNNDPANEEKYGKLYNWYAVDDPRGLAPQGWHIPSDTEWRQLTNHLGGEKVAGTKMKRNIGWEEYEGESGNGNNESGFSALPGGARNYNGTFDGIGLLCFSWSSTMRSPGGCYALLLGIKPMVRRLPFSRGSGMSVRCIQDYEIEKPIELIPYLGEWYHWMPENLNVDIFRNGDSIPQAKTDEEWKKAGLDQKPAWCYYNNDPANGMKYGKLYNEFAVNDSRGLAPEGWHIPSLYEWKSLIFILAEISI
jgi:uncharacterized protein (TIGR02145 family)